ncbi:TetR/AcrR family transcriptional regulator [Klebsiella variicola]|nr:TetR/AcrR family transcriptional regulator [Klebsiella variicola]MBZ7795266.1 TetR/AcrR family transcriptional regulator [Klebsiella variicola]MBZ7859282.1 TetR/AcrR family transcriptional regulator [Klebsiella variicola]MCC7620019.1 TetR/AcrR family transcriptional regulator [Klebsiella variicola]MCC7650380.1 TetR/AcrR family transcriptional regulator [Klebsiella variicola]
MTRKKEIDKEKVLDAAESLILESGGRLFTLDAVAERAGISKGGLVYTFSSKDGLIHAVLEREVARFQEAVRQRLPAAPVGPIELVLAHIEEALAEEDVSTQMAAFLITALVHAPGMLEPVRSLYRSLLDPLRSVSGEYVTVRHALLAVEGVFLLRGFGLADISAEEIKSVLRYAHTQVLSALAASTGKASHAS